MKKAFITALLMGFGLAVSAQAKDNRIECANLLSPDQFLAAIGETGSPKFIEKRNKGCNYVNDAETRNVGWTVSALSSDEEWTKMRDGLKMVAGYGINLTTDVPGVGADAYVQGSVLFFLDSTRKYRVTVLYADKGITTPQERQAAIRKTIALDLDKTLSKS